VGPCSDRREGMVRARRGSGKGRPRRRSLEEGRTAWHRSNVVGCGLLWRQRLDEEAGGSGTGAQPRSRRRGNREGEKKGVQGW
jgi:hypothetical protein